MSDRTGQTSSRTKAPARSTINAVDESSFTSFADLGAAIPSSEGDDSFTREGGSSTSLFSLSGLRSLLHPNSHLVDTSIDETTPLIQSQQRRQLNRRKRSKRYVGGENAFAAYEAASTDSDYGAEASLAVCRHCEAMGSPISAVKLVSIAQILFAVMSLLSEVLARDKSQRKMSEMQILTCQSTASWIACIVALLSTKTAHP
jgi:hypothetical protein